MDNFNSANDLEKKDCFEAESVRSLNILNLR